MAGLLLTRPMFALFPFAIAAWYFTRGVPVARAFRLGAVVVVTTLIGISPWLARNHRAFGTWTEISANGGFAFLLGNAPQALGSYGTPNTRAQIERNGRLDGPVGCRLGWENIKRDPVGALRRTVQKLSYFVALETDGVLWNLKTLPSPPPPVVTLSLLALANIGYAVVVAGTTLAVTAPNWKTDFTTLFVLAVLYVALMSMIFIGDPRYHFVLIPCAALCFAQAVVRDGPALRSGLRRGDPTSRRWLRRWVGVNATLTALILLNLYLKYLELRR